MLATSEIDPERKGSFYFLNSKYNNMNMDIQIQYIMSLKAVKTIYNYTLVDE